jgi:hypothetical protein
MRRLPLVLALSLAACAGGKAPETLVVRQGLTAAQLEADGAVCLAEAKAAERGNPRVVVPPQQTAAAQAGAAAAAGAMKGWSDMERFMAAHDACLTRLGYSQVALTAEQKAEYAALRTAQGRTRYIVEFSARQTRD